MGTDGTTETPMKEIPDSVIASIGEGLLNFLVPILAIPQCGSEPDIKLIGSGTLVTISDSHYILTAAHVWDAIERSGEIHLALPTRRPSRFTMLPDEITPKVLWNGSSAEWGPDLALLEIPLARVGTIEARRSFLNLSKQKAELVDQPPKIEKGFWVVTGMVEVQSSVQRFQENKTLMASVHSQAFCGGIQQTHERQSYDYFDTGAELHLPGVPNSFGGVSGGGLWQADLSINKEGTVSWDGKRHLRGVAFWESPIADQRRAIRCHGPRSLYDVAWSEWGLPNEPVGG